MLEEGRPLGKTDDKNALYNDMCLSPPYSLQVKCRDVMRFAVTFMVLLTVSTPVGAVSMAWDGNTALHDIEFRPENFLDINSYQFRPSEDIRWYDVENGWRVTGGSLESNRAYLYSDIRLKRSITPNFSARLSWSDEELYAPRDPERPLLELELQPTVWPLSLSLLGAPAYAKSEAELGLAVSMGMRPWNYVRVAWLKADYYYNGKNEFDNSYYRHAPSQFAVEAAYKWGERNKLRLVWYDNKPQAFVLDNQVSVFAYRNRNFQGSFDYQWDSSQTFGISVRGFDTRQSRDDGGVLRAQDIRYHAVNAYRIRTMRRGREWTLGIRYDDFRNREHTSSDLGQDFDFLFNTTQAYSDYYLPFLPHQAWDLGLYLGDARKQRKYPDASISDWRQGYFEAMLRTGWDIFSIDNVTTLSLAVSWNLDDLIHDSFDGGSVWFRTQF
jgi:hypothetical protein